MATGVRRADGQLPGAVHLRTMGFGSHYGPAQVGQQAGALREVLARKRGVARAARLQAAQGAGGAPRQPGSRSGKGEANAAHEF